MQGEQRLNNITATCHHIFYFGSSVHVAHEEFTRHHRTDGYGSDRAAGRRLGAGPTRSLRRWVRFGMTGGVPVVDLYGGTRHSLTTTLKSVLTPEQIKSGTMHTTNKAFERYFQRNSQESIDVYSLTFVGHDQNDKKGG